MHRSIARAPSRGFTLLELMIVVAVMGILAAIAIPNYFDQVQRSRITEATTFLGDMRSQMEKFYMDNRTYLNGGNCAVNAAMAAHNADPSAKFAFSAFVPCTATTYRLQAVGSGPMAGFVYTIDQQNTKVTVSTPLRPTSGVCWVSKKDGTCL